MGKAIILLITLLVPFAAAQQPTPSPIRCIDHPIGGNCYCCVRKRKAKKKRHVPRRSPNGK